MADTRGFSLGNQFDIEQILLEAQHRWLRPAEICEILRNYKKFQISPEPPNMPGSGSLFLFDKKVLRYFRNDGHNWRKKKDGKRVKETHEKLKACGIDVLHCYYAHGEENDKFQRRSYWMLEEEFFHMVLVHYLEVKYQQGNRTNYNHSRVTEACAPYSQETEETIPNSEIEGSQSSRFHPHNHQVPSQTTNTVSMNSAQSSEYEHVKSDNYQGRLPHVPGTDKSTENAGFAYDPEKLFEFQSWEDTLEKSATGLQQSPYPSFSSTQTDTVGSIPEQEHDILGQPFTNNSGEGQEFGSQLQYQQGNRTNYNRSRLAEACTPCSQETEETIPNSEIEGSQSSRFHPHNHQVPSQTTNTVSMNSAQSSEYEHVKSDDYQGRLPPVPGMDKSTHNAGFAYDPEKLFEFQSWEHAPEKSATGLQQSPYPSFSSTQTDTVGSIPEQEHDILGQPFTNNSGEGQEFGSQLQCHQGNRTNYNCSIVNEVFTPYSQETEETIPNSEIEGSQSFGFHPYNHQVPLQTTNTVSMNSAHSSEYELVQSEDYQGKLPPVPGTDKSRDNADDPEKLFEFQSWEDALEKSITGLQQSSYPSFSSTQTDTVGGIPEQDHEILEQLFTDNYGDEQEFGSQLQYHQGNRTNYNCSIVNEASTPYSQETEETIPNSEIEGSQSFGFHPYNHQVPSQTTNTVSMNSAHSSEYELVQSEDYQGKLPPVPGTDKSRDNADDPEKLFEFQSWEDAREKSATGLQQSPYPSFSSTPTDTVGGIPEQDHDILGQLFTDNSGDGQEFGSQLQCSTDQKLYSDTAHNVTSRLHEQDIDHPDLHDLLEPSHAHPDKQYGLPIQPLNSEHGHVMTQDPASNLTKDDKSIDSAIKQHLLDGPLIDEGLKKNDSFTRWMSEELDDVKEFQMQSSSGAYWETVESAVESENVVDVSSTSVAPQEQLDSYMLDPSISQDLLFSIIDFSPNWAYEGSKIKVLITGRFLLCLQEAKNWKWSCMFGEVEVPAEIIADGVLRCHTPAQKVGRVPFYITCSNRLACSEVQEFEYRVNPVPGEYTADNCDDITSESLHMRFGKFDMSDEQALSLLAVKSHKPGHHDEPMHAAAIRIQSKFRSYKGRKDFLIIRQRIVKIQAHVRGHQVRKNYRKIIWSVGTVEKIILRWRRKGSGLRGFKSEALTEGSSMQVASPKEDDYDFLKEGRKQKEQRLQKALARVKSMVQYPEARDQYHRLLNVVTEIQETKAVALSNAEETADFDDDLIDIEALLDDDTLMPTAS